MIGLKKISLWTLKYFKINKNDEFELIKSLDDKGEIGNADEIKKN